MVGEVVSVCTRKIVNCYRMFAELQESLAGGRALDKAERLIASSAPGHKHLRQSVLVVQFLSQLKRLQRQAALVKMKLKEFNEDPQQRALCFLTNTQNWKMK